MSALSGSQRSRDRLFGCEDSSVCPSRVAFASGFVARLHRHGHQRTDQDRGEKLPDH